MKNVFKVGIFYVLLFAVIIFAVSSLWNSMPKEELLYSDIRSYFTEERVKNFVIEKDVLKLEVRDEKDPSKTEVVEYELRDVSFFVSEFKDIIAEQYDQGIIEAFDYPKPYELPVWVSFLPYILVIVLFAVIWYFAMNQMTGGKGAKPGSFGKSRARVHTPDKNKVFFKDVAGADEEKAELEEIVEFLKDPVILAAMPVNKTYGVFQLTKACFLAPAHSVKLFNLF